MSSAKWLLWLLIGWTVCDVIKLWSGKNRLDFSSGCIRVVHAEIKLQHHSHIHPSRLSKTSLPSKQHQTVSY